MTRGFRPLNFTTSVGIHFGLEVLKFSTGKGQ